MQRTELCAGAPLSDDKCVILHEFPLILLDHLGAAGLSHFVLGMRAGNHQFETHRPNERNEHRTRATTAQDDASE